MFEAFERQDEGALLALADPDVVMYATFSGGLLFLLRHGRTGVRAELALAGLGFGLALGTKWYGVSSFAVVLIVWAAARLGPTAFGGVCPEPELVA